MKAPQNFDRDSLYLALLARDKRFDGRFYVGVKTTGIYCRPVCPARPLLKNVTFYKSAAEAEGAGFRPCLRCRPDLSPSAPLFKGTGAVVGRALRLIAEGAADQQALSQLAEKVGLTDRHLRRLFVEHVGAGPLEVAISRRLHLARMLLSQTRLPVTDIAFASGFRSLRRFNQAFVDRYQRSPRHFRREGAFPEKGGPVLELPVLEPYDWKGMISFLARHAVPGLERVTAEGYERLLPGGGSLKVSYQKSALLVALSCSVEHMREQIERVRHLFDIDHNPAVLPPDLRGIRVPGAFDVFETAATIILSQLVSVSAARAACKKLVQTFGHPVKEASGELTHLFPTPTQLTQADIRSIGIPKARAEALRLLAVEIAEGRISLARSAPLAETRQQLLAIPGIGPWTVELIALRCLADPDAFPARDLVVARALQSNEFVPEKYSPWRAYLTLRLWQKTLNLREEKL